MPDENSELDDTARRDFLKQVGTVGAITTTGAYGFAGSAAAYNEIDYKWKLIDDNITVEEHPDSGFRDKTGIAKSFYLAKTMENGDGDWVHHIKTAARGVGQRSFTQDDGTWGPWKDRQVGLQSQRIWIKDDQAGLFPPAGDRGVGANPGDCNTSSPDYGDAAYTALKGAFSAIHPATTAATIAADVADALQNSSDDKSGNDVTYTWDYNRYCAGYSVMAPVDHFVDFYVESDPNKDTIVGVEHHLERITGNPAYSTLQYDYFISEGPSTSSSVSGPSTETSDEGRLVQPEEFEDNEVLREFADGEPLREVPASEIDVRAKRVK